MKEPLPETFAAPKEGGTPPVSPQGTTGPHELLINVLGANFSIMAGEDPAYLDEVLAQYCLAVANTQGISGMKDPLKVAILTGFLLCDEINKVKRQVEEDQANTHAQNVVITREYNVITQDLIDRIDLILEKVVPDET